MTTGLDPTRFLSAQEPVYAQATRELANGKKRSHWMWFIFPQIAGLGMSPTSAYYAIPSADAASAYLAHPTLGQRLRNCTKLVLEHARETPEAVFGDIDAIKFRSSMTLFETVSGNRSVFTDALEAFYAGERDPLTLEKIDPA